MRFTQARAEMGEEEGGSGQVTAAAARTLLGAEGAFPRHSGGK